MNDVAQRQQQLIAEFSRFRNWEERYKHVIDLGKSLPDLPADYRQDQYLVKGCQSRVWLHAQINSQGLIELFADSDAMIVKGLVSLLVRVYSLSKPEDVLTHPPTFISELGFQSHLSPSRANGLMSMVKQIMLYATAFKALQK